MHNVQCRMNYAEGNEWTHEPCVPYNILSNKRMNERSSLHVLLFSCLKIMHYALSIKH